MQNWLEESKIPVVATGRDGAVLWETDGIWFTVHTYLTGKNWKWNCQRISCDVWRMLSYRLKKASQKGSLLSQINI